MSLFLRHNKVTNTIDLIQCIDEIGLEIPLSSEANPKAAAETYIKELASYNKTEPAVRLLTLKKPDDTGQWGSDGGANI
jgi:hypothetical protein